jgi:hypothetical protein
MDGIPMCSDEKSASFVKFLMENMPMTKADCEKACAFINQIDKDYPNLKTKGSESAMNSESDKLKNLLKRAFTDAIYFNAPLSWHGYEIQRLYEGMGERPNWLVAQLEEVARTLRWPREEMKVAAISFGLQRDNKDTGFPERWAEADRNDAGSPYRFWTLFYFAFIDFLRLDCGSYLQYKHYADPLCDLRFSIATEVVRQLIGYRGSNPGPSRIGDYEGYEQIAAHAKQNDWIQDMTETPESILALAFQANGWAEFRSRPNVEDGQKYAETPQEVLAKVAKVGLSSDVQYSADEWERRALFFMVAQRLYVRKDLKTKFSRERALFAVLYLDLYRRPLGEVFTRKSFKKKWDAIPFEKKEDFAAECRKLLVGVRNEAAKHWPEVEES